MLNPDTRESASGKFTGLCLSLPGAGKVELAQLLSKNNETAVYATSRSDLLVKVFDLECGKPVCSQGLHRQV